jgi:PAS domain S-box-containing protein
MEEEAWARVAQGQRAARALYNSWQSEVTSAAVLAAQLPTLRELLAERQTEQLVDYLWTVETSLALDMMHVCETEGQRVTQIGAKLPEEICAGPESAHYEVIAYQDRPEAWVVAARPVQRRGETLGTIVTGIRLDDGFANQMQAETGLEHTLFLNETPIATSFPAGTSYREEMEQREREQLPGEDGLGWTFQWQDTSYYALRLPITNSNTALVDEIALAATDLAATQRGFFQTQLISIALAMLLGSLLGIVSAMRIGDPLRRLARTASNFGNGDLNAPVAVNSNLQEVNMVAETMERARVDLQQTITTLHDEKVWIEHLLQAIVEGIVTLDETGHVTFFSSGAERLTGWDRQEVVGRHVNDLFQLMDSTQAFSDIIPASGERTKVWVCVAEGQAVALSITRSDLLPPEVKSAHIALVFRDVSEEEAVQHLLGHFLANVTHEFRTPLTALSASTELLLDQSATLEQAELEQMLTWLHLGILSLQTLVDNLLEASSLEAGRFRVTRRPADLGEIIGEATRLMKPLLEKYNQYLVLEMPPLIPRVEADARRVVQVLVNLLSNAHKYGPVDSEIKIKVSLSAAEARIAVSDRGPGVPVAVRETLFRRFTHFQPGQSSDSRQYGVGLGLWVVKAIVDAHGGEAGVEDRPGGGSTFWFTLPLAEEA